MCDASDRGAQVATGNVGLFALLREQVWVMEAPFEEWMLNLPKRTREVLPLAKRAVKVPLVERLVPLEEHALA